MANQVSNDPKVWRLWHGAEEVARVTFTGGDFPWMHGTVEELPGFEPFREAFRASESDGAQSAVRRAVRMTFPDGEPVPEFWLVLHEDGTCGWRWSDETVEEPDAPGNIGTLDTLDVLATARRIIASDAAILHRLGTV